MCIRDSIMAMFHSSTRLFDGIMYIVVVICGAFFIKAGTLTAPEFMAFMLYANMMLNSIRRLVQFAQQFQSGLSGVERFVEIMDTKPEIVDQPDAVPIKDVKGHIQFSHVDFKYASDEKTILHDINLDIPAGTNLAIVGPSGAGKTTICNLIPRFYEPTSGIIYIDGKDIQHVTMESLRDSIGIVQQDVYLFYGTVAENIEYGRPGATPVSYTHLDRVDIENELRECEHLYHDVLLLGTKRISGIRRPINLAEEIVDLSGYMLTYILKQNEEASAAFARAKKQGVVIHNCCLLYTS